MTLPPVPVEAVTALVQGSASSLTRQAIEAALRGASGMAMDNAAHKDAEQTQQTAAVNAQRNMGLQQLTAVASTPLGTLQAQSSSLAQASVGHGNLDGTTPATHATEAVAVAHNAAPAQAMPLQGVLAVPVALSSLSTPSAASPARTQTSQRHEHLLRIDPREEPFGQASDGDTEDAEDDEPASIEPRSKALDPRVARWLQTLRKAGQQEALRDLALGRKVLLVLPAQNPGAARSVLLGPNQLIEGPAQWWPGTHHEAHLETRPEDGAWSVSEGAAPSAWPRFRLFRDGDLLLRGGLRTRAGALGCRLLLGSAADRLNAMGALQNHREARLALPDRARLAQALASQWTLLMLVVPNEVSSEAAHA
jgi:hypothetical protein